MGVTVKLNLEAATALLAEARRDFENGAQELYSVNVKDESQRPTIEATVEVIGHLSRLVESPATWWPREDESSLPIEAEVEFTAVALEWMEHNRAHQEVFVAELDGGEWSGCEPGYLPEQVYLLHVLTQITEQATKAVAV